MDVKGLRQLCVTVDLTVETKPRFQGHLHQRLVFTSDGVGVVVGVIRELVT